MKFHNKPVYRMSYRPANKQNYWSCDWRYEGFTMFLTRTSFKNILEKNTLIPKQGDTLYFCKSSTYPRFKAAELFKRCIKTTKADVFVIGRLNYQERENTTVIEDDKAIYVSYTNEFDAPDFLQKDVFLGSNPKIIYQGNCLYVPNKFAEDATNILNGTYSKLVTDIELDKIISPNLETLTLDAVKDVCNLLDSPDKATQGLGLKLLLGYNVIEHALLVRFILGIRHNLKYTSEWNSKGVQQLRQAIKYKDEIWFPNNTYCLFDSEETPAQMDIDYIKEQWGEDIKHYVERSLERIANFPCIKHLNYVFTSEFKEQ